ncbi:MAG: sulfotransferase [Solirubrobacterales bacterium]|nr:sulfotransferase [Solirubrobacterales bacterium]
MAEPFDFPHPIFVGGVGRSGTHPMGHLVAADPRYTWVRTETRFHASSGGLPDLYRDETTMSEFLAQMRGRWWKRGHRQHQGLQRIIDREDFDAALAAFERDYEADRVAASRRLVKALLDPSAERKGTPAWVEITGEVVEEAPFLLELFPRAKFINMVRDGRAVVAGTLRKADLTDDPMRALHKWRDMVQAAADAIADVPADRVLTIFLDDFTAFDREGTFERLVEFLELDDPAPMRVYFDNEISSERAHVGKWRERMAPQDARMIDRRYRRLVKRMHRKGIEWAPEPRPEERAPKLLGR